jgi:hypothetical protein
VVIETDKVDGEGVRVAAKDLVRTFADFRSAIRAAVAARLDEAERSGLTPGDLGDPQTLARRAAAIIPVRHPVNRVVEPVYDTAGVADWLGISRQAVHKAARTGRMLGCLTADRRTVFPVWQFADDGTLVKHLREVLAALGAVRDPWRAALWLAAPAPYLPGNRSAIAWLSTGGDPQPVLAAAVDDAAHWAA